ncbi:hypothetical protein BS78_01G145300 [Paspalum vaginatum]|nr:hypothetical protein BS78_01G145300 [Paspalum vaginatum]
MHPRKRQRRRSSVAAPLEPEPVLPPDVLLEIVARSDAATLVRCAASCKPLRREILRPAFIRRVCHEPEGVVPPRLLGFLRLGHDHRDKVHGPGPPVGFSLAHPATPAAESFSQKHLAPLLSRNAAVAKLLNRGGDRPLTSRNGLVLLYGGFYSAPSGRRPPSFPHMCVYDPMAGNLATFCGAPGIYPSCTPCTFVLLTAADGIGCSFLVVVVDFTGLMDASGSIKIQTMSADDAAAGGTWAPSTSVRHPRAQQGSSSTLHGRSRLAVVVLGGFVHWLMHELKRNSPPPYGMHILTYHVGTATVGTIELPTATDGLPISESKGRDLHLASSPDGRLSLVVMDRQPLTISIWLLSGSDGWARHAVIDAEANLRSLLDQPLSRRGLHDTDNNRVCFASSSWGKSDAVLLKRSPVGPDVDEERRLIVLDVETEEMWTNTTKWSAFPYEVDLESRLSAMKTF